MNEIKQLKIDIAVLTETKKKSKGLENWGTYDHFNQKKTEQNKVSQLFYMGNLGNSLPTEN